MINLSNCNRRVNVTIPGTARGVPMLLIPFFGDQKRNAMISVRNGNGLMIPFSKITTETFSEILTEMLTNKTYNNRAKEIASLFNDNLVHPMEEAIFWIEYVMRSKGAKHLKSHAVNMSWFSYLLLDVLVLPIAVIISTYILITLFLRQIFNKKNSQVYRKERKLKRA